MTISIVTFDSIMQLIYPEECVACGAKDAQTKLGNPLERGFHEHCLGNIKNCENELLELIKKTFSKETDRYYKYIYSFEAHRNAVEAVRKHCGTKTLKEYKDLHGELALKEIFDKVGKQVVVDFANKAYRIKSKL